MQHTTETPKQYQCRHIFTDGRRCGSNALRNKHFCYYHHTTRKPVPDPQTRKDRLGAFDLPLPEDRSAIQAAIGQIIQRIASNDLDPRRAGLLLYALQIASLNLPKPQPSKPPSPPSTTSPSTPNSAPSLPPTRSSAAAWLRSSTEACGTTRSNASRNSKPN